MKNQNHFTIIGFGNQAKAWAMNLRDSGYEVYIGLRSESKSFEVAKKKGFKVFKFEKEMIPTTGFALLTPDETHFEVLSKLSKINTDVNCYYAHGFSMVSEQLEQKFPKIKHILLAPKAIASELRFRFETKENLTAFYSLEYAKKDDFESLKELAQNLGINNIYPTSFDEETKADLFSEQSILCSLLPYGINEAYKTLIERGYSKELAFFECFYESKLILDTIFKMGPQEFFNLISPNALIGSEIGKNKLFDSEFKKKLSEMLDDIEKRQFENIIQDTNVNNLKESVSNFWNEQDLNNTFKELKESL